MLVRLDEGVLVAVGGGERGNAASEAWFAAFVVFVDDSDLDGGLHDGLFGSRARAAAQIVRSAKESGPEA